MSELLDINDPADLLKTTWLTGSLASRRRLWLTVSLMLWTMTIELCKVVQSAARCVQGL